MVVAILPEGFSGVSTDCCQRERDTRAYHTIRTSQGAVQEVGFPASLETLNRNKPFQAYPPPQPVALVVEEAETVEAEAAGTQGAVTWL